MDFDERVNAVSNLAQEWLSKKEQDVAKPAELMNYLVEKGVYKKDNRKGKPLRDDLRKLKEKNQLGRIRGLVAEKKQQNIYWSIKRI